MYRLYSVVHIIQTKNIYATSDMNIVIVLKLAIYSN